MEWVPKQHGHNLQVTQGGTSRACLYYYVYKLKPKHYIAGRWMFNREIDYGRVMFNTAKEARAYCEDKDLNAVIITEITANKEELCHACGIYNPFCICEIPTRERINA